MPKYVRKMKMARRGRTYTKKYVRKGVTAKLVKTIIHNENEKRYAENLTATALSANTYTYTIGGTLYNAPLLVNFWNIITQITVGSAFNQREGSKIYITKLLWKINIRAYSSFKTPYNNITTTTKNDFKPCIRVVKSYQRKIPNGPVAVSAAPFWNTAV